MFHFSNINMSKTIHFYHNNSYHNHDHVLECCILLSDEDTYLIITFHLEANLSYRT